MADFREPGNRVLTQGLMSGWAEIRSDMLSRVQKMQSPLPVVHGVGTSLCSSMVWLQFRLLCRICALLLRPVIVQTLTQLVGVCRKCVLQTVQKALHCSYCVILQKEASLDP